MPADSPDPSQRRAELLSSLGRLRTRLREACSAAGRNTEEVTLIAVTKTFPTSDAAILLELGICDLGENRDQEARRKAAELAVSALEMPRRPKPVWHFIGQLQTNKARSVAHYADVVHSVDRVDLVEALARGVRHAERDRLGVFIQVNLGLDAVGRDPAAPRGGAAPADVPVLADVIAGAPELRLVGVMAVAPRAGEPGAAFDRLAQLSDRLRAQHPDACGISAGMSNDLEAAIQAGSTHVRVGSALLGQRDTEVG